MNRTLTTKLKKTSKKVREVAEISKQPIDDKPENFISKCAKIFELVVEMIEIYDKD